MPNYTDAEKWAMLLEVQQTLVVARNLEDDVKSMRAHAKYLISLVLSDNDNSAIPNEIFASLLKPAHSVDQSNTDAVDGVA